MARKPKKEEHINHERWLVSYADFVTLLFAFFTALYAMSTVDAKKASKMQFSTRSAFNLDFFPTDKPVLGSAANQAVEALETAGIEHTRDTSFNDAVKNKKLGVISPEGAMTEHQFRSMYSDLSKTIEAKKISGMTISNNKYGIVISLKDFIFFDSGKAELKRTALPALDAIAERVLKNHFDIRVEGHTDGSLARTVEPQKPGTYRNNWDLSTGRAASVVNYFIEQFAYPPEQLSVAGFASTKPLGSNDTAAGRAQNRRVDIVVLTPKHNWLPSPSEVNQPEHAAEVSPPAMLKPLVPTTPAAPTPQSLKP